MRGFPAIAASESHRVRRWDAVILGGALPGLVAAIQIAKAGCRVLLLEEEHGGEAAFGGLREPFHLSGPGADHVLGGMLRELGISLIDQRRVTLQQEGLQIALPDARIDIGPSAQLVDELAAWRLAAPEESRDVLRALEQAGARERRALLLAPLVRAGRRRPFSSARIARGRAATEEEAGRGMPPALAQSPRALRLICDILVRALGNHARRAPSPEASARLLGSALEGSYFVSGGGLRDILFRRLEALAVDRRRVPGDLRFVSVANQPGLSPTHTEEIWTGRALLLNAPAGALGAATAGELPVALDRPQSTHERVCLHFLTERALLPESMGDRVIAVTNPADPLGEDLVCLRSFPGEAEAANLVASAVVPRDKDPRPAIEQCVRKLLPFSEQTLHRQPLPELRWDRDADLEDPPDSAGWPDEVELRLSSRPLVYALDRRAVASLGFEGDLLLGWRAGQAIAAELQ